jgi:hypothetical protein
MAGKHLAVALAISSCIVRIDPRDMLRRAGRYDQVVGCHLINILFSSILVYHDLSSSATNYRFYTHSV